MTRVVKPVVVKTAPVVSYAPKPVVSYAPAPKVAYKPYVDPYADEPAYYTYEYAVNDDYSKSAFDANESRDNYLTTGKYSVALPGEFNNTISGYNNTISCLIILFPGEFNIIHFWKQHSAWCIRL